MKRLIDVRVRAACGEDAPRIAALEALLFSDAWSEKSVKSALSSALSVAFVAESEGQICGYLLASLLPPEGELYRIGVQTDARRQGLGGALMGAFLSAAAKQGCTELFLEVRADNIAAISLYQRVGFEKEGVRKGYYHAPEGDALCMRLKKKN